MQGLKRLQNDIAHNKTKNFHVWKNPVAIFSFIQTCMMEQCQVKCELLFCAKVLLEIFKNKKL